jgi:hypothetical protein
MEANYPSQLAVAEPYRSHPVRTVPRVSNVWMIGRPLDFPSCISFVSRGKLPFCHWGVLVSEMSQLELEAEWCKTQTSEPSGRALMKAVWGNMYELYRDPQTNLNKPNVVTDFGPSSLVAEWTYSVKIYVGTTLFEPSLIYGIGITF